MRTTYSRKSSHNVSSDEREPGGDGESSEDGDTDERDVLHQSGDGLLMTRLEPWGDSGDSQLWEENVERSRDGEKQGSAGRKRERKRDASPLREREDEERGSEEKEIGTYVQTQSRHTSSQEGKNVGRIRSRKIVAPSRDSSDGELRDGEGGHGSNGEEHGHEERDRDEREDHGAEGRAVVLLPVGLKFLVNRLHRRHVPVVLCLLHRVGVDLGLRSGNDDVSGLSEVSYHHGSDSGSNGDGSEDDRGPPTRGEEKEEGEEKGRKGCEFERKIPTSFSLSLFLQTLRTKKEEELTKEVQ